MGPRKEARLFRTIERIGRRGDVLIRVGKDDRWKDDKDGLREANAEEDREDREATGERWKVLPT
jgi:hypothetical protein